MTEPGSIREYVVYGLRVRVDRELPGLEARVLEGDGCDLRVEFLYGDGRCPFGSHA